MLAAYPWDECVDEFGAQMAVVWVDFSRYVFRETRRRVILQAPDIVGEPPRLGAESPRSRDPGPSG